MHLSIWSYFLEGLSPEEMVSNFSKKGWQYSELSSEHGWNLIKRGNPLQTGEKFKAFAGDHNFSFPQAHFDLGVDISHPAGSREREEALDNLKRWCDLFSGLDVRAGVIHPGGERLWDLGWERTETLKLSEEVLHELLEFVADTQITLCLENSWHYEDTMHLVDTISSPGLAVCMDTGHLNLTGGNWKDFIKWAGERLKALHIADNMGIKDDHILPYGAGTIQWSGFSKALREVGYQGLFNFEIGGESRGLSLSERLVKLDTIAALGKNMIEE